MITLTVGYKQQLGILVKDVYGNIVENAPTPVWTFSNDLADIDANGLLTAGTLIGFGDVTATITVGDSDISGLETIELVAGAPATVEVIPVGYPVE